MGKMALLASRIDKVYEYWQGTYGEFLQIATKFLMNMHKDLLQLPM